MFGLKARNFVKHFSLGLFASLIGFGCSYKTPIQETPPPTEFRVQKTMFEQETDKGITRKRFLCGWTPEKVAGEYSDYVFAFYNKADHCNIEFEITEDELVGKLVSPSFPNDRARWQNIITIPITKHYNYEREVDKYNRTTNRVIENTSRDHWSRRPYMNLDFTHVRINNWAYSLFDFGKDQIVNNVEDVEWDMGRNFFAFTVEAQHSWLGSMMQGKFRFNFLAFEHDESFNATPYSYENSKNVNILHVLGKMVNGDKPEMYAAKWDTRAKHDIYLNNFPEEYVQIGKDVIELWNDEFQKIGHGRPFNVKVRKDKYAFDLRYPGITWVSDKSLSLSGPLGVAMASADVLNGKVLWGGVTIWGGLLEKIINSYTPAMNASAYGSAANTFSKPVVQFSLMDPPSGIPMSRSAFPDSLKQVLPPETIKAELRRNIMEKNQVTSLLQSQVGGQLSAQGFNAEELTDVNQKIAEDLQQGRVPSPYSVPPGSTADTKQKIQAANRAIIDAQKRLKTIAPMLTNEKALDSLSMDAWKQMTQLNQMGQARGQMKELMNADFLQRLIGQPMLAQSMGSFPTKDAAGFRYMNEHGASLSRAELREKLVEATENHYSGNAFDYDRSFAGVAFQWNAAMANKNINKFSAVRALTKDILLHEVGHMLGMGHNFKENILPERGTVPAKYLDGEKGLVAKANHDLTNYTTVMGYKNGVTDVLTKYEDLAPGPNDTLVLRYLYNNEYPVFPLDAKDSDDYKFVKLEEDGIMEKQVDLGGRAYRLAFFPSCNDVEASFGVDPYCNRWDRGYDAKTLVKNYFEDYKGNLTSQLYAFANNIKGGSYWYNEYYLWMKSLSTFGRVRVFYDYMRQKYENELSSVLSVGGQSRIQNLLDFSQVCKSDNGAAVNKQLADLFADPKNAELKNLCEATGIMFEELKTIMELPGPDSTKLNYFDSYASSSVFGGDARPSYSRFYGSWTEIARNPLKISALYTLTSPYPFVNLGGWLLPVDRFSRFDGSYLLNTFYPKEFSQAIASTVDYNLAFANTSLEPRTKIGRSVLALGYFLMFNYQSNDPLSIDQSAVKNVRDQTLFDYNFVAIEVERKAEDGKEIAKKFKGTIYNFYGRGNEKVDEVYMYTNDRTVILPPNHSLLYPLTRVRWYSASNGYYYAIKMDYPDDYYDRLKSVSVRQSLGSMYYETMKQCIQGTNRNGLRYFFNDSVSESVFPGFTFPVTISERDTDKAKFFQSLENQFDRYYRNEGNVLPEKPDPKSCEEALRGQGLLVLAASAINGYYLFDLYDYIEKGFD